MDDNTPIKSIKSARDKILGTSLESSRKSYYPQLLQKLREAKENEEKLQLLIDKLPVRIAQISSELKYVLVNSEYERVFNKSKSEIIGRTVSDVLGEENYRNIEYYTSEILAGKEVHFETEIMSQEGKKMWNEYDCIPIFDKAGTVTGFYVLALDLTEKKRSEQEKKKLELRLYETEKFKTIGTLAGGVAHDFNNLLMGIQGHASLLEVKIEPSSPLMEHVQAINEHIKSATSLTRQLLGLSRGGKYNVKPIDICELVSKYSQMFGRTRKEITIHYNAQQDGVVVDADHNQIEQVLLNLLINAWQAMSGGGDIYLNIKTVSITDKDCLVYDLEPGDYACISVTDTGTGMDKDVQLQIFDPFFTTKEKQRGTGLGLASAYGIIKNHGGIINVYSEVGQGSRFNVYLPLSSQNALLEKKSDTKYTKASGTILLIDDEELILNVGKAMLETIGYTVLLASNGKDAMQLLSEKRGKVDLVILDMILPGMDGGEIFDCIRDNYPSLPVILSSGYSLNEQVDRIITKGCEGFLQKPFNISDLSLKVAEIIRSSD